MALSANDYSIVFEEPAAPKFDGYPLVSSGKVYKGSLVGMNPASGYVNPLSSTYSIFLGHADEYCDTSLANVQVRRPAYKAKVTITSVAITDVGRPVYASDDATFSLTKSATNVPVGKVAKYDTTNTAWVEFSNLQQQFPGQTILKYVSTAASTAVTATATETAFDKKLTIPAAFLRAGDIIRVRAQGIATAANSTDTLTVKLYFGTEEIETTGAVNCTANDIFAFDADIVVRTSGASGTVVAAGWVCNGVEGTVTAKPFLTASATESTDAACDVVLKATWSTTNSGNSCRLDVMNVQVIR